MAAKVFVETVDRGSLSAAAEATGMSRAMTSRYLEGLEDWLGVRLLHRTTRRLTLTDAGEKSLPSLRQMLELAEDVRSQAHQARTEIRGRLRIATSASFAEAQLTSAIVDFQAVHPAVEVELLVVDRPVNLVSERIDLAVRITNQLDEGLIARRLAVCRSILCASPDYLLHALPPRALADLHGHRIIAHTGLPASALQLRDPATGKVLALPLQGGLSSNETSVLHAAALAGAGIAMLPSYYVRADLQSGRLQQVLADHELAPLGIHAVYASRRYQPKALRHLVEFLTHRFDGDVPPWEAVSALSIVNSE